MIGCISCDGVLNLTEDKKLNKSIRWSTMLEYGSDLSALLSMLYHKKLDFSNSTIMFTLEGFTLDVHILDVTSQNE